MHSSSVVYRKIAADACVTTSYRRAILSEAASHICMSAMLCTSTTVVNSIAAVDVPLAAARISYACMHCILHICKVYVYISCSMMLYYLLQCLHVLPTSLQDWPQ
jgi:hypothetical protein